MTDKKDALAPQPAAGLAPAPAYVKQGSHRGMEGTVQGDLLIPRLGLAQALSPQVTDGDPNRIPDLKVGDLFNSVTHQVYGKAVTIQVLRKMPLRATEFYSIDDGGGVRRPNVPLDDPALRWGNSGDKKADKPKATLFRDFLVVILPSRELIALSFKSSGIKVAKELWGLVAMRNADVWAGKYRLSTAVELQPKPHQVFKIENDGWVSEEDLALGEKQFEAVKIIAAEQLAQKVDEDVDDASFDTDAMEKETVGGRHARTEM